MMSLFSHFDLNFFFLNIVTFITLSCFIYTKFWKSPSSKTSNGLVFNYMETFFCELLGRKISKTSWLFFYVCFVFMLTLNLFSVFSYSFPLSSQLSLVLFSSLTFWFSFNIFGYFKNGKGMLSHLVPEGSPIYLAVFLFLIELVSSTIRPITLTVRLTANILAGHLLMLLLSKLIIVFQSSFLFLLALNLAEMAVSIIQSYIFATLLVLYYSEIYDN